MIIDRDTPAVFVVGCPRSGTTLLQEILNRHPDLAIGPETHFFSHFRRHLLRRQYRLLYRFLWSDNLRRKLDRRLMPRHRVGDQFLARIDERRVLEAFADFPYFVETGMPLSAVTRIPVEGLEPAFARVFARWLGAQGVEGGARVIGEKTPIHVMHMHEIQSIFPYARFVHIVRDAHGTNQRRSGVLRLPGGYMMAKVTAAVDLTGWPLPDEYLIEIGRVCVVWSSLEAFLNLCIGKLAGFDEQDDPRPFILIAHSNFSQRLDMFGALCERLTSTFPNLMGYKDVIVALRDAQKIRNKFVHNTIGLDPETGDYRMPVGNARGRLRVSVEPVTIGDIRKAQHTIDEAGRALYALVLRRDIGPLSERLSEQRSCAGGEDTAAQY